MNHFLVLLVVIFLVHVFSVGGANSECRRVKHCNIPVNKSFTCGESEYRCPHRCTVNSKYNLYSVRRINSSFYRCVFHLCRNEMVGCQGHLETNCLGLKTYIKDGSGKEKILCVACIGTILLKREKHPWSSTTFSKVAKACKFTKSSALLHSLFYVF